MRSGALSLCVQGSFLGVTYIYILFLIDSVHLLIEYRALLTHTNGQHHTGRCSQSRQCCFWADQWCVSVNRTHSSFDTIQGFSDTQYCVAYRSLASITTMLLSGRSMGLLRQREARALPWTGEQVQIRQKRHIEYVKRDLPILYKSNETFRKDLSSSARQELSPGQASRYKYVKRDLYNMSKEIYVHHMNHVRTLKQLNLLVRCKSAPLDRRKGINTSQETYILRQTRLSYTI